MRNNNEYFKHGFINSMANLQKRESKLPMNNLVALQLLADQELYNYDFCEIMIPVGG